MAEDSVKIPETFVKGGTPPFPENAGNKTPPREIPAEGNERNGQPPVGGGGSPRRGSRSRSRSRSRERGRKRSRSRSRSPFRSRSRSRERTRRRRSYSRTPSPPSRYAHTKPPACNVLGVFGLSSSTTEKDLEDEFGSHGRLEKADLIIDKRTGRSRCFAFLYFAGTEDAERAKNACNGMKLHGRNIRTDFSFTQKAHEKTPGHYMGRVTRGSNPSFRGGRSSFGGGGGGGGDRGERYMPRSPPRRHEPYGGGGYEYEDRYYRGGGESRERYYERDHY